MVLRMLVRHVRLHPTPSALLILLQLVQAIAILWLPTLNAGIIDQGIIKGDNGYILRTGGVMLAVTVLQVICAAGGVYFAAELAMALGRDLRAQMFERIQSFSAREVGRLGVSSLVTRTTNDVQQLQMVALLVFTIMVSAPIVAVGSIVMALGQDVPLSGALLVLMPVLAVVIGLLMHRMRPLYRDMQQRIEAINRMLREQISGIRVIRAFVKEAHEQRRFAQANRELMDVSIRSGQVSALMIPGVILVVNLCSVAVMWFGALRIDSGGMQVGALTAFLAYLVQLLTSVILATSMFMLLPRAEVCAERVHEVLATASTVSPSGAPTRRVEESGHVELRHASFAYTESAELVLRDIDLVARRGETVAVVGSTGSGKSTLLGLIPRLFDVTSGQVLINGVDVRDMDPRLLTSLIGYVPQNPYLFSGTVASNLRYGRPEATDEELWHALEVAQGKDFVQLMDGGLDAPIAQGGSNVSGGQRQRLAIARALVRRPEIYLFDDSFSALDYATDAALRAALAQETESATVIVVAQRVSSIRNANRIVVLDEGRVVGTGTHAALMESSPTYRELVLSQIPEGAAA
ncbi:ABC transporter ATP-binding protein [Micromonospora eburnea]|uniref:ATP-binding cassette, subfamily B n=1 Tax=Micromonospora eburnea TaxID=227316 RepID=A0A1C6V0U0_9ACTN|nr:ABC transporter ATP-binding protein [Micromonospora eburnea]SCL59817.1 ATP-binding cassette, subfamily B [Micromonospora eburnea]